MTGQEIWKILGNLPYENTNSEVLDSNGNPIINIKIVKKGEKSVILLESEVKND